MVSGYQFTAYYAVDGRRAGFYPVDGGQEVSLPQGFELQHNRRDDGERVGASATDDC